MYNVLTFKNERRYCTAHPPPPPLAMSVNRLGEQNIELLRKRAIHRKLNFTTRCNTYTYAI